MALFDYSILNTPVATDATVAAGLVSVNGLSEGIDLNFVTSYTKTAYAAGVVSKKQLTLSGTLAEAGTVTLTIAVGLEERQYQYTGVTGATSDDIVTGLLARLAFDADFAVVEDDTSAGAVLKLALKSEELAGGDFTMVVEGDGITTVAAENQAYVAPAGTPDLVKAEVLAADVASVSGTGEYAKYVIVYDELDPDNVVGGDRVGKKREVALFVDETSADYADLESRLDEIFEGTVSDASAIGGLGLKYEGVALSTSYDFEGTASLLVATSVAAGGDDINLPSTTGLPVGYSCIVKNSDGANSMDLVADLNGAGTDDTIDGGASLAVAAGEVYIITVTAVNTWISVQLA